MELPQAPSPLEPTEEGESASASGRANSLSVLELGARRGIGPLSGLSAGVWHGEARPCVSCGHLLRRLDEACTQCGQDMTGLMLEKMQAHAGPWYVHEHVRPFPGVSLERLIRQIRRGVLNRSTVVRGPTTHHQWRFASETPVLSKYLGHCWVCQAKVKPAERTCGTCGVDLDGGFKKDGTASAANTPADSAEIQQLRAAIDTIPDSQRRHTEPGPVRVARLPVGWAVGILALLTLAFVLIAVSLRADRQSARDTARPAAGQPVTNPAIRPSDSTLPAGADRPVGDPSSLP